MSHQWKCIIDLSETQIEGTIQFLSRASTVLGTDLYEENILNLYEKL